MLNQNKEILPTLMPFSFYNLVLLREKLLQPGKKIFNKLLFFKLYILKKILFHKNTINKIVL